MASEIKITAVGDILMWGRQIRSAKNKQGAYSFYPMFQHIAPYLKSSDLTIGNLETTLSGREKNYQQKSPKTGYPKFNSPDELASTLKNVGFDILTTANNHCMDRGVLGLKRTLNVLDRHHLLHTGTFRSKKESNQFLIKQVKGIKVGLLAYTYGTNYIPIPKDQPWLVNYIQTDKIVNDLRKLRSQVDLVIVALHFGREFRRYPNDRQKNLVSTLFKNGAHIILGAHPHVLQPMAKPSKNKFVIYSLGNFISMPMMKNIHSESGVILNLYVSKDDQGKITIKKVNYIPTWSQQRPVTNNQYRYRVLPIKRFLTTSLRYVTTEDKNRMRTIWKNTTTHLKGFPK